MKKLVLLLAIFLCFAVMNVQKVDANPTITDCLSCHNFDPDAGLHLKAGHATCTSCHQTVGDTSATPSKCAVCHPAGNPGGCNLVVKHASGNCMDCHGNKDAVQTVCETSSCAAAKVLGEEDPGLVKLRTFRDKVLARSAFGKRLIKSYYSNSDAVNACLENSPALKALTYKALQSIISVLQ